MKGSAERPRLPNFNHLYYFYVTAREGSISAAASKLGVTQPTISEQIKSLERFLGAQLFERHPEGMRLTESGQIAYEHAEVMFRASTRLMQRFEESAPMTDRAVLRLGVTSTLSRTFTADYFLPLFEIPEVRTVIHYGNYIYLLQDLLSYQIDLLIADSKPDDERGIEVTILHTPSLVFVASPELAARISSFPADLVNVPFLHYTVRSRYRWEIDQFLRKHGLVMDIVAEVDDIGIMKEFALQGKGAIAVPNAAIDEELKAGALRVLNDGPVAETKIFALYHHETPPTRVLNALALLRR